MWTHKGYAEGGYALWFVMPKEIKQTTLMKTCERRADPDIRSVSICDFEMVTIIL